LLIEIFDLGSVNPQIFNPAGAYLEGIEGCQIQCCFPQCGFCPLPLDRILQTEISDFSWKKGNQKNSLLGGEELSRNIEN